MVGGILMLAREKKTIKIKQGVIIFLSLAIIVTLLWTGISVVGVLQENQTIGQQAQLGFSGIDVKKGLLDVKITFPSSMVERLTDGETPEQYTVRMRQNADVKNAVINQNGTITLTVKRSFLSSLATETRSSIQQAITTFVQSGEHRWLQEVAFSGDMGTFTLKVSGPQFDASASTELTATVGTRAMFYCALLGDDSPTVEFVFKDSETNTTLHSVKYPAAFASAPSTAQAIV